MKVVKENFELCPKNRLQNLLWNINVIRFNHTIAMRCGGGFSAVKDDNRVANNRGLWFARIK